LWHEGTTRKIGALPNLEALPVGPSGLTSAGVQVNEPLTETEIANIVHAFAQAAADAKRIGFDGIEIHGAHGYLIDEFFWDKTNHRTDRYGGDIVARTLFATEIIAACRLAVGPDFPICLRISQWKESTLVRLEKEEFDLVAVGRALLVDPKWANKIREGKYDELMPFSADAFGKLS
jgi:2,4-dienoyl-CoA reductase-like NADH-dependent reductase (Old Yellow Enzyme family)